MKNIYKSILYIAAAVVIASCARAVGEGTNVEKKRYFDAWMSLNYPELKPSWNGKESSVGVYIIPEYEVEGTGIEVKKEGFALIEFTQYDLNGNISDYTDSTVARQLGTYEPSSYYGPTWFVTYDEAVPSGLLNAMVGMKVGSRRRVIIPSWMMTYTSYDKAADYLDHSSDYSSSIYDFTIKDFADTIDRWEIDSVKRYIVKNYGEVSAFANDTLGFYFRHDKACPEDVKSLAKDTTIYINYTGKLLNGLVFDTTSERIAKDNNIYDPDKDYAPVRVTMNEDYSEITMGEDESEVIAGFSMTLADMQYSPADDTWKDSATGIFISALGYTYSGSGASIPAYAPLIFEIEIVDKPE